MSHHYVIYEDVRYVYPNGFEALKGVSFHITHGERVAILGRNGAGKSTLLLLSNGLLVPTSGKVNIGGIPVGKKTLTLVRQAVGMVFQNPDDQLFMPTVEEDVAFGPINMGLPMEEVERRVTKALEQIGMLEYRRKSPSQLSGGQKRRVAISTVLSMEPSILVLDEPTSNLDFGARRELIEVLKGFSHTQIIVSHDLEMIKELCPRVIVLDDGRVIADGPCSGILADPEIQKALGL